MFACKVKLLGLKREEKEKNPTTALCSDLALHGLLCSVSPGFPQCGAAPWLLFQQEQGDISPRPRIPTSSPQQSPSRAHCAAIALGCFLVPWCCHFMAFRLYYSIVSRVSGPSHIFSCAMWLWVSGTSLFAQGGFPLDAMDHMGGTVDAADLLHLNSSRQLQT